MATPAMERSMNIYDLITDYNTNILTTLNDFTAINANDNVHQLATFHRLIDQFTLFSQAKENSFYAELIRFVEAEVAVRTVIDAHRKIIQLFDQIAAQPQQQNEWDNTSRVLQTTIEQVINYEQNELFSIAHNCLNSDEEFELAEELAMERHILAGNDHEDEMAEKAHNHDELRYRKGEPIPGIATKRSHFV
jgi:hypothetical protein